MEINVSNISFNATRYDVKAELTSILHDEDLGYYDPNKRKLNFHIALDYAASDRERTRNIGTGRLTLPSAELGKKFMNQARNGAIIVTVLARRLRFAFSDNVPSKAFIQRLRQAPFQDPAIARELDEKRVQFRGVFFRVDKLQFGFWARRPTQTTEGLFYTEWEESYGQKGSAIVLIDFDRKRLVIQIGEPEINNFIHNVSLGFSDIREAWSGAYFGTFVCFDSIPAVLERARSHNRDVRGRIHALDVAHARVYPYAHQLRWTFFDPDDLSRFTMLCKVADLRVPQVARIYDEKHGYFEAGKLTRVTRKIESLPFNVAFQVEAMLRSNLIHTDHLLCDLWEAITKLVRSHPDIAADTMRVFGQELARRRQPYEQVPALFNEVYARRLSLLETGTQQSATFPRNLINCHHVTFTPTQTILEGPYVVQSNRVIRKYPNHQNHFLRVDFRDEGRLLYRWDADLECEELFTWQVGGILNHGFTLAGRHFEFLAYSQSSLRSHAVWFMSPFVDRTNERVCPASIRKGLGDFSLIVNQPAKYAARIALAFTATNPSVKIDGDKWTKIEDLYDSTGRMFTDGVGTISSKLSEEMWNALCAYDTTRREVQLFPTQYQIRFMGCKGVVVVDEQLTECDMRIRQSMNKFEGDRGNTIIEVAEVFNRAKPMHLNRPLIMHLEDHGVHRDVFLWLQDEAVRIAKTAADSTNLLCKLFRSHGFCPAIRLPNILDRLERQYCLSLKSRDTGATQSLADPFMMSVVHTAMNSVMRDIKHRAHIPVPDSWNLVGVADEGVAYEGKPGYANLFTLPEDCIFVCVQERPDSPPRYIKGHCVVSRSPCLHPGDVQTLWAIGPPPDDKLCLFRHLRNCIVFPCKGKRSLPSCLSGGDLDGDEYQVSAYRQLLPSRAHKYPGEYRAVEPFEVDIGGLMNPATGTIDSELIIPHVCDFILDYIRSDILGLCADAHLVRADQSSYGVHDKECIKLAEVCSQAVDYPKSGVPVSKVSIPRRIIPFAPDWKAGEVPIPRRTDFYRSEKALGYMYRKMEEIRDVSVDCSPTAIVDATQPLEQHPIYTALAPVITASLALSCPQSSQDRADITRILYARYVDDLRHICQTHTLSSGYNVQLTEEEVVAGTILAHCSGPQNRWRKDRMYAMRVHTNALVQGITNSMFTNARDRVPTRDEAVGGLERAWIAWKFSVEECIRVRRQSNGLGRSDGMFGLNSFGYIALEVILDCLDILQTN